MQICEWISWTRAKRRNKNFATFSSFIRWNLLHLTLMRQNYRFSPFNYDLFCSGYASATLSALDEYGGTFVVEFLSAVVTKQFEAVITTITDMSIPRAKFSSYQL